MNFSKKRPVKIVMLGAGGTGAHIAPHLYRLLYALERPVKFIICDGDKVEPKNLVRQNFTEADLGENKARVIAERYSDVFGLETSYIPRFIEDAGQLEELLRPEVFRHYVYGSEPNTGRWVTNSELVILIGAVDNNKSRKLCHEVFLRARDLVYIDSGNGEYTGQIVCGIRRAGKTVYKPVGMLYPEVSTPEDLFPTEVSCAEASVSAPQTIVANLMAATAVVTMIYNILVIGCNTVQQTTFSTKSVNIRSFHAYGDAAHVHEALGNVLRFAAKRSRLPILEEAQVRFEDGHCVLTCTNLDQWCMSTIPAVGDSFSFVFVGTRKILSACKYFSGELELTYTIEPTETNPDPRGQISISDGKRSLKRSTERTSDFPELKEKPLDRHYPVNPKRLLERFKRVKYAVSSNDARPNQCCIEFLKDKIIAVDGYRLAMSTDPAVNVEKPFYIPPEVMAELTMFKDQDCTISVGEEWAAVESETLRVLTRIPGYDGFDVERAIPTSFSTEYPVDVDQLLDEVRYLNGFITAKTRKPIRFDGGTLSLETPGGTYLSKVGLPPVEARGLNPKYLLEGLEQFKAKKVHTVTMKMGHPHSPMILTDGKDDLAMVLPVRLKEVA